MGVNFSGHGVKETKQIKIGHDVWIGNNVSVTSGVTVGTGAVIGMGAVVVKDIGPYEIWAGNPARFIRKRFDEETIKRLLDSRWWEMEEPALKVYAQYFNRPEEFLENFGKKGHA